MVEEPRVGRIRKVKTPSGVRYQNMDTGRFFSTAEGTRGKEVVEATRINGLLSQVDIVATEPLTDLKGARARIRGMLETVQENHREIGVELSNEEAADIIKRFFRQLSENKQLSPSEREDLDAIRQSTISP